MNIHLRLSIRALGGNGVCSCCEKHPPALDTKKMLGSACCIRPLQHSDVTLPTCNCVVHTPTISWIPLKQVSVVQSCHVPCSACKTKTPRLQNRSSDHARKLIRRQAPLLPLICQPQFDPSEPTRPQRFTIRRQTNQPNFPVSQSVNVDVLKPNITDQHLALLHHHALLTYLQN